MNRSMIGAAITAWSLVWFVDAVGLGAEETSDATHTVFGLVAEPYVRAKNVPVCLCDAETGLPLEKKTHRPSR